MPVLSKEDFLQRLQSRIGEDTSDEALQFLEDMSDTYNDFESRTANTDLDEWKTKYEELDQSWRQRYKERFLNTQTTDEEVLNKQTENVVEDGEEKTFDDLFTEREG